MTKCFENAENLSEIYIYFIIQLIIQITGKIIRKHIMKIFWFLKNRIILKTYYVFFSSKKQIMFFLQRK